MMRCLFIFLMPLFFLCMLWEILVSRVRARQHGKVKRILKMVEQEELSTDEAGVVILPANLAFASRDGNAYVVRRVDLLLVFVPVWRGKGANIAGNLICNRPLTADDTHEGYFGATSIRVLYPQLLSMRGPYGPGINEVSIDEHWVPKAILSPTA